MTKTQTNAKTSSIKKTRNATLEIARFVMALLIFCTHLDQLDAIHNTFLGGLLKSAGEVSLGGFVLITGYFMVRQPGKFKALTSMAIFILLLFIGWVFDAIVVGSAGHIWAGPSASHYYTVGTFFQWQTTLFIMFFGTAIHWYMWQIFIVMLLFPILAYGLQKLSKNRYLFVVILLLSLDAVFRIFIMSSGTSNGGIVSNTSHENGLGLFGYTADSAPIAYAGYSWMFLMSLAIAGGYMQLHSVEGDLKRAWILVVPFSLILLSGIMQQINISVNYDSSHTFQWNNDHANNHKYYYYNSIIQGEDYGSNWLGFLSNNEYISPVQIISMITLFYGLIQLPTLKSKVGLYLGSLGFALYVVHVATMSASIDIVHAMNADWATQYSDGSGTVSGVQGGGTGIYILIILFSWILTLPIAMGSNYLAHHFGRNWLKLTAFTRSKIKFFGEM